MDVETLKGKRLATETQFNSISQQAMEHEKIAADLRTEMTQLKGEYRAYTNLINTLEAPSTDASTIYVEEEREDTHE